MSQEPDQRIVGYFIEEGKDHLNTIEQGLLNLQNTLEDPEMVNEVFRAAHSLKGGAAMLGLDSIQQTSHHLEDYFKDLQECPQVQVDQKLESLFLAVFDNLKELLEQLEDSFCLPEDVVNNLMAKVEPVFKELKQHLGLLVNQARGGGSEDASADKTPDTTQPEIATQSSSSPLAPTVSPSAAVEKTNSLPVFENQVIQKLRQMLQLFKQTETPQSRQQLQKCSEQLVQLGEEFKLPSWCTLCQTASEAIANGENTYRTLAPIVIKEIKQSQELVLAGREAEITTTEKLQALSTRTCS